MATDPDQTMNAAAEAIEAGDFDTLRKRSIDLARVVQAQRRELAIYKLAMGHVDDIDPDASDSVEVALADTRKIVASVEVYMDQRPDVYEDLATDGIVRQLADQVARIRDERPHEHYESVRGQLGPGGYYDPDAERDPYAGFVYETGRSANFPDIPELAEVNDAWSRIEAARTDHIAATADFNRHVDAYEATRQDQHLEPEEDLAAGLSTGELIDLATSEIEETARLVDAIPVEPTGPDVGPAPEPPGPEIGP